MKPIKIQGTKEKLVQHCITIFSGYYHLTKLEQSLLKSIIVYYLELEDKIKDDVLLKKNFLDAQHRTLLTSEFSIKPPQLTNYLNKLKDKKVLKEEEGTYYIDQKFIPTDKIIFEFKEV